MTEQAIVEINHVSKSFKKPDKSDLLVIDDVNFIMREGEVVALLGKSGSGKSTLLRIIAGLTDPSQGEVLYRGMPVKQPVPGISMIFQSFALMPWLTVLANVELGLEALGIPARTRRERALKAIDIIGMDGFESAFPKELSGGMRQRVGFARALVVNPDVLLMDEPFSALDVLTAETLRNDLLELWQADSHMKGILFITHNIEEAVLMADRIIVFGSDPGCIRGELKVALEHPRNDQDKQVSQLIDDVYTLMTTAHISKYRKADIITSRDIDYRVLDVSIAEMIGLLEAVNELQQKWAVDLPELADEVRLDIDSLFPVLETLSVLELAKVSDGDITISTQGRRFIAADITDKKVIFAKLLLSQIPLARYIVNKLKSVPHERLTADHFLKSLSGHFTEEEAERVLTTVIDWGRYAELFAYDYNTGILSLEDVE